MIVRAFWGAHIDLSKVVAVGDAVFYELRGYNVSFEVHVQLLDKPITPTFDDMSELISMDRWADGGYIEALEAEKIMVPKLQKHIDKFVKLWKESKNA